MNKKLHTYFLTITLSAIVCALPSIKVVAQEAGYFRHQFIQPILINAGATGFQEDHQILVGYRSAWSDFPGSPKTYTALYHGAFADNIGLGFQVLSDNIGVNQLLHGQLNFAYRFNFDQTIISAGLSTGIQTYNLNDTEDDQLLDPTDELLNEALDGYTLFDGSVGVYGEVDKKFLFGLSFPNLVKNRITDISGDVNLSDLDQFSYAVFLGYRFNVKDYNFTVEPSVTVKDLRYSPFLVDANVKLSFLEDQLVGGIGYTLGDESRTSLLLGTRINALYFFYSYEVSLGDFQQYNNGSHELTLVYRIPKKSNPEAEQ